MVHSNGHFEQYLSFLFYLLWNFCCWITSCQFDNIMFAAVIFVNKCFKSQCDTTIYRLYSYQLVCLSGIKLKRYLLYYASLSTDESYKEYILHWKDHSKLRLAFKVNPNSTKSIVVWFHIRLHVAFIMKSKIGSRRYNFQSY